MMIKALYLGKTLNTENVNLAYIEKYSKISYTAFYNPEEALNWLGTNRVDIIFVETGDSCTEAMEFFKNARRRNVYSAFIIITAESDLEIISDMYYNGVLDVIVKPFGYDIFSAILDHYCDLVKAHVVKGVSEPSFFSGISFFAKEGSVLEKLLLDELEKGDFSASELAEKLNQSVFLVAQCLNRLAKSDVLEIYINNAKRIYCKKTNQL